MRVGVISDTHDNARNVARIVAVLREAHVERVIHTGDITRASTLRLLAEIAVPVFGVYVNNDIELEQLEGAAAELGVELAEPSIELYWAGLRRSVLHGCRAHPLIEDGSRDASL